jgi:hypothetical protein
VTGVGPPRALCIVTRDGLPDLGGDPLRSVRQRPARRPRPGSQAAKTDQLGQIAHRFQGTATARTQIAQVIGGVALAPHPSPAGQALGVSHADHRSSSHRIGSRVVTQAGVGRRRAPQVPQARGVAGRHTFLCRTTRAPTRRSSNIIVPFLELLRGGASGRARDLAAAETRARLIVHSTPALRRPINGAPSSPCGGREPRRPPSLPLISSPAFSAAAHRSSRIALICSTVASTGYRFQPSGRWMRVFSSTAAGPTPDDPLRRHDRLEAMVEGPWDAASRGAAPGRAGGRPA